MGVKTNDPQTRLSRRICIRCVAVARSGARNILLDEPTKWPGYTHGVFIVDSLQDVLDWAASEGVVITEGPVDWGRRLTCFLRDPDGNVLEFNELLTP